MTRQLYVDLDGVLADFDGHYETLFGVRPDKTKPEPPDFWAKIDAYAARGGQFFRELVPMPDAFQLWDGIHALGLRPVLLSGIPRLPGAAEQKAAWVAEHFGRHARLVTCASKDKYRHCRPGDVLVDDWAKYRHLWEAAGGIFVVHTSARDTLMQVGQLWKRDQL